MTRKENAALYSWALGHGLVEVREIIEWADSMILEDLSPELNIINLSLSGGKKKYEIMDALLQVSGYVNSEIVFKKKLALLYDAVRNGKKSEDWAVRVLYYMADGDDVLNAEIRNEMYYFDYAFEIIPHQSLIKRILFAKKFSSDLLSFLRRHSS